MNINEKDSLTCTNEKIIQYSDIVCREIRNPLRILSKESRNKLIIEASEVLESTTCEKFVSSSGKQGIEKFIFGALDRGRVLFIFEKDNKMIGFDSINLLNDGNKYFRFKGNTVLHFSSGHILPEYQGNNYIIRSTRDYIENLSYENKPRFIEGFTQNPRVLRLITKLVKGRIVPNSEQMDEELLLGQEEALRFIESGGTKLKRKNNFVLEKKSDIQIYGDKIYSGDPAFDRYFYYDLGVNLQTGDLVNFFAKL